MMEIEKWQEGKKNKGILNSLLCGGMGSKVIQFFDFGNQRNTES